MVQRRDFGEYLRDLKELLTESFDGKFHFSVGNDMPVARELYNLGIEPTKVLLILQDFKPKGSFNLSQAHPFIKERIRREAEAEAREAAKEFKREEVPYRKVKRLLQIVRSILLQLNVPDKGVVIRLEELLEEEDLFKIERELYRLEDEFFKLLKLFSPYSRECLELAKDRLEKFSFYWKEKVLKLTEDELIKECLRKKHGIPEFSAL